MASKGQGKFLTLVNKKLARFSIVSLGKNSLGSRVQFFPSGCTQTFAKFWEGQFCLDRLSDPDIKKVLILTRFSL